MKKIIFRFLTISLLSSIVGCTAPYDYQTNEFDDIISIEATITDQYKNHEVKVTRSYKLEEKNPTFVTKAVVYVTDDKGNKYDFKENGQTYTSINQFQASPDRAYELHVKTADGRSYISKTEKLPQQTQIESVVAKAKTKNDQLGIEITVNSNDPTKNSRYYRYEYEETYKIVAPKWYNMKAVPVYFAAGSYPPGQIIFENRTSEARICFSSQKSNELLLTNTNNLSEDRVTDFPVRFIPSTDPIIKNRYSILVKQYVQNLSSHTFFETLKEMSDTGSLLSQTQPGFLYGNIISVSNPAEKVLGYFEVSSYSEKRIFFNFTDLLTGQPSPAYQYDCPAVIPDSDIDNYIYSYCFSKTPGSKCQGELILALLSSGTKVYFPTEFPTSYLLFPIQCGDCTSFSSNIKPAFWID